jgi:hypothetical protein
VIDSNPTDDIIDGLPRPSNGSDWATFTGAGAAPLDGD